jgi:DNA-binding transcriptional MocR family regulator
VARVMYRLASMIPLPRSARSWSLCRSPGCMGPAYFAARELARRLNVSRTTVTVAYDRLTGEGFITSRVGAGTYVSDDVAGHDRRRPEGGVGGAEGTRGPTRPAGRQPPCAFSTTTTPEHLALSTWPPTHTPPTPVARAARSSSGRCALHITPPT